MMQIETLYRGLKLKDMTQEEKYLLVKDFCARLPYNVKAYVKNWPKLDIKYNVTEILKTVQIVRLSNIEGFSQQQNSDFEK